jgi:hypothetical protein
VKSAGLCGLEDRPALAAQGTDPAGLGVDPSVSSVFPPRGGALGESSSPCVEHSYSTLVKSSVVRDGVLTTVRQPMFPQ